MTIIPKKFKLVSTSTYIDKVFVENNYETILNLDLVSAVVPMVFMDNTTGNYKITGVTIYTSSIPIQCYGYTDELYEELLEFLNKQRKDK